MESNFVFIISFLDGGNFITKFNKTKLHALSGTCNNYNYLYNKCLKFLVF